MNSQTVEITSAGIRKILNKYTPERAGQLELNLAAFLFGYQVLYDIEIVYLHRLAL